MKTFLTGFDTKEATFEVLAKVSPLRAVAYTDSGEVYYPEKDGPFTGIVVACRDNLASVVLSGYAVAEYDATIPRMGICNLAPGEEGYLEVNDTNGKPYTVLSVDHVNKTFEFLL